MKHRYLLLIAIASCGTQRIDKPSRSWRDLLCCDPFPEARGLVASSKVPVVTNVCLGSKTLWSGQVSPGKPLEVPVASLGGGKQVSLQFVAGTASLDCVDRPALAKVPRARDLEITLTHGDSSSALVPDSRCAGCTCPVCPEPRKSP